MNALRHYLLVCLLCSPAWKNVLRFFFIALTCGLVSFSVRGQNTQGVLTSDYEALVALYDATNGSNWSISTGWKQAGVDVASWHGVTVVNSRVVNLNLPDNQLIGSIPQEIGNLSMLSHLNLSGNQLSGGIPPEIGGLGSLAELRLFNNQLSGSIPPEIGNLSNLSELTLQINQLSGSIPPEIGSLTNLSWLNLRSNQLSGSIPSEIGNLGNLSILNLHTNQLSGSIPPELGSLPDLLELYLYNNQLSGSISSQLGNLSSLSTLALHNNQLSGSIPLSFSQLTGVGLFLYSDNELCEPDDPAFQQWLSGIASVTGTGVACLSYCDSYGESMVDEFVAGVFLGTIGNTSSASSGGYGDYTFLSANLAKGQNYTLRLYPGWPGEILPEAYAAWIDFNMDGDFEDDGEMVFSQAASTANFVEGNFIVPETAVAGATRMRVSLRAGTIPVSCEVIDRGEVEDYTVVISNSESQAPCDNIVAIDGTGASHLMVFSGGGVGQWDTEFCFYHTSGQEQVYSFTAPASELYSITVTAASGYVDYGWSTNCSASGWVCIDDINSAGTYGALNWEEGVTYYLLLDDEDNEAGAHEFFISTSLPGQVCETSVSAVEGTNSVPQSSGYYWYSYTMPADKKLVISSSSDQYFEAYSGSCEAPEYITGNYEGGVIAGVPTGTEVLIVWEIDNEAPFDWVLSVEDLQQGDVCEEPLTAVEGVNAAVYSPQWYSFTMPEDGSLVISSVGLTSSDTYLYVYDGCGGTELGRSDDFEDWQSKVELFLTQGSSVLIFWSDRYDNEAFEWSLTTDDSGNLAGVAPGDYNALVALYNATDGTNWGNNIGWLQQGVNVADWYGVTVDDGRVTAIDLGSNNLVGFIPSALGDLSGLTLLGLYDNQLSGSIPAELGNLSSLKSLWLDHNQLSGSIPAELGNLSGLISLGLYRNQLSGNIPASLGNLGSLTGLYLHNNQLSGGIPPELGNLSSLSTLHLQSNQFSGTIPAELGELSALHYLWLHDNQLSGEIPAALGQLSMLQSLALDYNQLSGSIPAELGQLSALQYLALYENQLSGAIPAGLGQLSALQSLYLQSNQLSGTIPAELGNLSNLGSMDLSFNQLSGSIPLSFSELTAIERFLYSGNEVCEPDDPEFQQWIAAIPETDDNRTICGGFFSFTIPGQVGGGQFDLQNKEVTLYLPEGADLTNLVASFSLIEGATVWVGGVGQISGQTANDFSLPVVYTIASEDGLHEVAWTVSVLFGAPSYCASNGENTIDEYIGRVQFGSLDNVSGASAGGYGDHTEVVTDLSKSEPYNIVITPVWPGVMYPEGYAVWIDYNRDGDFDDNGELVFSQAPSTTSPATGQITVPEEVQPGLTRMRVSLMYNQVPAPCGTFEFGEVEDYTVNILPGGMPGGILAQDYNALVALYNATDGANWGNNIGWLSGEVTGWYGIEVTGDRVTRIDLQANNLGGVMPVEIGDLTAVTELWLSENGISGEIPATIGQMSSLQFLRLDNNPITGTIPAEITQLSNLIGLDLWNNDLSGEIPAGLWQMTGLQGIALSSNQLTGELPAEIGNLVNLSWLDLGGNQFTGSIPAEIGQLVLLPELKLNYNQFTGDIPASLNNLDLVEYLRLEGNNFTGMPDLTGMASVVLLNVANNHLSFSDLLPNAAIPGIQYSPQQNLPTAGNQTVTIGSPLSLSANVEAEAGNVYQWFKQFTPIDGANSATYLITEASVADGGTYYLTVTNSSVPGLTLRSDDISVEVLSTGYTENSGYIFLEKIGAEALGIFQHTPGRIAVDSDGNIFASDEGRLMINKFSASGDFLLTVNCAEQLSCISDIEVDADGNLYVTDECLAKLVKYSPAGDFVYQIENVYGHQFQEGSYGLAIDGEGTIFLLPRMSQPYTIRKYNSASAEFIGSVVLSGEALAGIYLDLEVDELGNIYALGSGNGWIDKFSAEGTFINTYDLIAAGSNPAGWGVFHMMIGGNGDIYAPDTGGRIYHFNNAGGLIGTFGQDQLSSPWAIAQTSAGLLVSDRNYGLQLFDLSGEFVQTIGPQKNAQGQFSGPRQIAMDSQANRYVVDHHNGRVQKFDSEGNFLSIIGSKGTGAGQLMLPTSIAVDEADNLYIANTGNHRIEKFSSTGLHLDSFGNEGAEPGQFSNPLGVAISGGSLFVLDAGNFRVQKLTTEGEHILSFGSEGTGLGQFTNLAAIAIEADGNILIANNHPANKFMRFNAEGQLISEVASAYGTIHGLSTDMHGDIYIAGFSTSEVSAVRKLDNDFALISHIGTPGLEDGGVAGGITAVTSNPQGDVLWISSNPDRVSIFTREAVDPGVPQQDYDALVALYNATNGANWVNNDGWLNTSIPVAEWHGVTVSDGRVTTLSLNENGLAGPIPAAIGALAGLTVLQLQSNQLTGTIPDEVGNLVDLTQLNFYDNQLTGEIPTSIGNLVNLTSLVFWDNQLSGNIPESIGNLANLLYLDLDNNRLSGAVPASLANLESLTYLYLSHNLLDGIPPLTGLTSLNILWMNNNGFGFDDIAPFVDMNIEEFIYSPQNDIPVAQAAFIAREGEAFTLTLNISGEGNLFQWVKDGEPVENATSSTLEIASVLGTDHGFYRLTATNSEVPELVLQTEPVQLQVPQETIFTWENASTINTDVPAESYGGYWADYDNDGDEDLYVNQYFGSLLPNFFYENNGDGTFTKVTEGEFVVALKNYRNVSWGDINNDGFPDLFVPSFDDDFTARVYVNNTDKTFDIAPVSLPSISAGGVWGDIDNDGLLDLAVFGDFNTRFFKNNASVLGEIASNVAESTTWNAFFVDVDNDGDADFFQTPIESPDAALLYINNGNGAFQLKNDVLMHTEPNGGRGGVWADFDNDADMDFLSLSTAASATTAMYVNDGAGNFTLLTELDVFGTTIKARAATAGDFDNDGDLDLIILTIPGAVYYQNNGSMTFSELSTQTFLATTSFASISNADYNNDGSLDLFIGNFDVDKPNALYSNVKNNNNWLKVKLRGTTSNKPGVGARVTLSYSGGIQYRQIMTSSGLSAQNSMIAHFGLGSASAIQSVKVEWPSGTVDIVENPAINAQILIEESVPLNVPESDRQALVDLYNATGGASWTTKTNWLVEGQDVSTWHGVTVAGGRVQKLVLPANNLAGEVPASLANLTALTELGLNDNKLTGLPNLSALGLTVFNVSTNNLTFEDLEPNMSKLTAYSPQAEIASGGNRTLTEGEALSLTFAVGGASNTYQWLKDQQAIAGATAAEYTVASSRQANSGSYKLEIRNSVATGLVLATQAFTVTVNLRTLEAADIAALEALYNAAGGAAWTNRTGWMTEAPVSSWFGVTVELGRVTGIALPANNLAGTIPPEVYAMETLTVLNLADNKLAGTLPASIPGLKQLRQLYLHGNLLTGRIPESIGGLTALTALDLGNNEFFGTLPPSLGNLVNLESMLGMAGNDLTGTIPPALGSLKKLRILALDDNQFEGLVPAEIGEMTALTELYLQKNLLAGTVPAALGGLTNLQKLYLSENKLEGALPAGIAAVTSLKEVVVNNNGFISIPNFKSGPTLTLLNISNNKVGFGSIEPNMGTTGFTYSPQGKFGVATSILHNLGEDYTFLLDMGGTANAYQWYRDDAAIAGATGQNYLLANVQSANEGTYFARVTNSAVPGLELQTEDYSFKVSSLERDRLALIAIFDATGGANWINKTNWGTGEDLATWHGITVTNNRVTGISLPNNRVTGDIPDDIRDIGALEVVDFANSGEAFNPDVDNQIRFLPDMSRLVTLTQADLTRNRLGFASIEPNYIGLGDKFVFSPQRRFGETQNVQVEVGSRHRLEIDVSGNNNRYQWYHNAGTAGAADVAIAGATARVYIIDAVSYETQGIYYARVTSPLVPGFDLRNRNQNVAAVTSILGNVHDQLRNAPLAAGSVSLYMVRSGPYLNAGNVPVNASGAYEFQNIPLADYVLLAVPDLAAFPDALLTYYSSTIDWATADTLKLRNRTEGVQINLLSIPPPLDGDGVIAGELESDLPDETVVDEESRVLARLRVNGAGVSLSRQRARGKSTDEEFDYEFVAYTVTNENGEFSFGTLPDGTYLINIQFPGVPMDQSSDLLLTLGEDTDEDEINVAALVTPAGITVNTVLVKGIPAPYIKDLTAYPNPAEEQVQLSYFVRRRVSGLTMEVLDVRGQKVMSSALPFTRGAQKTWLDVSGLVAGVYIISVSDADNLYRGNFRIHKK